MRPFKIHVLAVCLAAWLLPACTTAGPTSKDAAATSTAGSVLFHDTMANDWQDNWFLDGQNAELKHRGGGLDFITTESGVDKNVDRAPFDARHAVLWTKQTFEGDIRIRYTYTMLPGCTWQKLIYIQAQGIGSGPYAEDIYAWRNLREVARMDKYFNYMDLIGLSLRDPVRCRRYPWSDIDRDLKLESEFLPRAENKGFEIGHDLDVIVEKRKASLLLRITDRATGQHVVDHTWDLTDEKVLKDRSQKFVEKGRIGLRLMGGHKINVRDFKVERLD